MKKRFKLIAALAVACIIIPVRMQAQTGNTGIGTSSPTTKLDINGALTTRESTTSIAVGAGPVSINALTHSQFRLTAATATFTITGPTTSNGTITLVSGARMVIVNASGQIGALNGFAIANGNAQEFVYSNGLWMATNGAIGATTYGFSAQSETPQTYNSNSFGPNSLTIPAVVTFASGDVILNEAATLNTNSTITVNFSGVYDISAFANVLADVGYATSMAVNVAVQKLEGGNWVTISGSRSVLPANSASNGAVSMNTSALVPLVAGDQIRLVVFRGAGAVGSSGEGFGTGGGGGTNGVKYTKGIKLLRVKGL